MMVLGVQHRQYMATLFFCNI